MHDEIILEDAEVAVLLPKNAYCEGHLIIAPKKKFTIMEELPDELVEKLFQVANKVSSVLFESLGCHGTNILIQNGEAAGQYADNVSINILPRFETDSLKLEWTPTKAEESELKDVLNSLSSSESMEKEKKFLESQKEKAVQKDEKEIEEDNYLTKSLNRLP